MTGIIEAPGIGHNQPDPMEMERRTRSGSAGPRSARLWRALEGTYSHLYKALAEEKRVYSSSDVAWKGGPQMFGKSVISPQATSIIQSIESTSKPMRPRPAARSTAISTAGVLRAQGPRHDVHDGRRIEWKPAT